LNWKVLWSLTIIALAMSLIPATAHSQIIQYHVRYVCTGLGDLVFEEYDLIPPRTTYNWWDAWYRSLPDAFLYTITYGNTTINVIAFKTGYIVYKDESHPDEPPLFYRCIDVYYGRPLNMRFPDINRDGKIDICDVVIVCSHYGETLQPPPEYLNP